jgi:hypothetical protein
MRAPHSHESASLARSRSTSPRCIFSFPRRVMSRGPVAGSLLPCGYPGVGHGLDAFCQGGKGDDNSVPMFWTLPSLVHARSRKVSKGKSIV